MKYIFGTMIFVGFLMVLGVAGSDCDGKCMERAMSLGDSLLYSGIGLALMFAGALGIRSYE